VFVIVDDIVSDGVGLAELRVATECFFFLVREDRKDG